MKRLLLTLAVLMVGITAAFAEVYTGSCGTNVTYTLDTETGVLKIEGTGAMTNYSSSAPWGKYYKTLTSVTISQGVTSIGDRAFYECSSLTSVTIPESVTSIGNYAFYNCSSLTSITIPEGVTSIGDRAFYECSSLTSVTIPESVTSIGNYAFYNCSSLTSITIPEGVTSIGDYAFSGCSSLTSITIPEGVTSIGSWAFYRCSSLTSINVAPNNTYYTSLDGVLFDKAMTQLVQYPTGKQQVSYTIPEGVTSIGNYAFDYCSSLTSVTIPNSVTSIGNGAFYGCSSLTSITIPNSVTSIGVCAFWKCSSLTSVTIPEGVTSIGNSAFQYCSSLNSVNIPEGVTSIGNYTFYNCSSLTSVTIPEGVTSIGNYTFYNCSSLTSVTIPSSVTSIGDYAFYNCSSLTSITIPEGVTSIGGSAFSGCPGLMSINVDPNNTVYDSRDNCNAIIKTATNTLIAGCKSTTIPSSVASIGNYAFRGCSSLTSITIHEGVKSIGSYAFCRCESLTSITIPEGVTSIGSYAFGGCSSLTSVTIPEGVTSIGSYAFEGCSSLTDVTCLAATPPTLGSSTFSTYGTLHVLSGCGDAYRAANVWKNFTIVEDAVIPDKREQVISTNTADATITFTDTGTYEWAWDASGQRLMSTNKGINSSTSQTTITINTTEECDFSFDYAVSSESSYDKLTITLDGATLVNAISGTSSSSKTQRLAAGTHTMVVKYVKDNSQHSNDDRAYVSNFRLEERPVPPTIALTGADKSSSWYAHNSMMSGFDEIHTHVSEGVLGASVWYERLDNICWKIGSTTATLYDVIQGKSSMEITEVRYKFVTPTVTEVKCATLKDYNNQPIVATLEVSEDGTKLYAKSSVFQNTVIATLNPDNGGIEYMQNEPAKEVLNWASHSDLSDGRTLTARVAVTAVTPYGECQMTGNEFDVKFLRPITFSTGMAEVSEGIPAVYDVEVDLNFMDWQNMTPERFAAETSGKDFAEYYDLSSIKINDNAPIMTDFAESGRFAAMTQAQRSYFDFAMDEVTPIILDEDYKAHVVVRYTHHQGVFAHPFLAKIPVILEYAWGKMNSEIVVSIEPVVVSTLNFVVDGEQYHQVTAEEGTPITLPEPPTKDGYTFQGWEGLPEDMLMPSSDLTVTAIFEVIIGDTNGDNEIDVADLSAIASYILGHPGESFVEMAADVNKDNEIDVADIAALSYLILHPETAQKAKARKVAEKKENIENAYNTLYADMLQAEAGTDVVLPIMMRNSIEATGFQLDLMLPEGVTLKDAALSNVRTSSKRTNLFDYARQADGSYRILCNSTKGLSFNGHDGEVMILTLHIDKDAELGAQTIALKDMVLTDATGMLREESSISETTLWVGNATGIHEMASEKSAPTYDLQGRQVSKKQKGIVISDGKKAVVK